MANELSINAENAWQQGEWAVALSLYLEILRRKVSSSQFPHAVTECCQLLERTSYLACLFGRADEADLFLIGFAELCRRDGLSLSADRVNLQRVHLALGRGHLDKAYELLDAMRPTLGNIFDGTTLETTPRGIIDWERERHGTTSEDRTAFFAQFYLDMGLLASRQGNFGLADLMFRRGIDHASRKISGEAASFVSPLRLARAESLIEAGNLRAAAGELVVAGSPINEGHGPGNTVRERELWAAIHMLAGEFANSLDHLRYVVSFLKSQGLVRAALGAQLNLARAQIFLLQTAESRRLLELVADEAGKIGDAALTCQVQQLVTLADWRLQRFASEGPSSVRLMQDSRARSSRGDSFSIPRAIGSSGSFLARFEAQATTFRALLATNDFNRAERALVQIRNGFSHSDSALVQVRLMVLEAELSGSQARSARACQTLSRVLPILRSLGLKPELLLVLFEAAKYAEYSGQRPCSSAFVEESHKLVQEMASSLPIAEGLIFLLGQSSLEEHWLLRKLDQLGDLAKHAGKVMIHNEIDTILHRLEEQKQLVCREVMGQISPACVSAFSATVDHCAPNRAFLVFAVLSDKMLVLCNARNRLDFRVQPIGRSDLRRLVANWHALVRPADRGSEQNASRRRESQFEEAGRELATALGLFEILAKLPPEVKELTFIPDDSLNGFPFAALRDSKGYLIERYAISIAYRRNHSSTLEAFVSKPLVAATMCGAPRYPIPTGLNDLSWLAKQFPGARQLRADEVNHTSVIDSLVEADLAHIVCHGEFSCDRPEETGLVLVPRTGEIQLLSLKDIASLNLSRLQHVTLVACWGADNYILPGRWVLGLSQVLCLSGAHSVLASLWRTHSIVADAFTKSFYDNLRGATRSEALRLTQLACLERREGIDEWAGWQLYGDTGPLNFKGAHSASSKTFSGHAC